MTDLEGIAKNLMEKGYKQAAIKNRLYEEYRTYKNLPDKSITKMISAVLKELKNLSKIKLMNKSSNSLTSKILEIPHANVTMGEGGVGCRGLGDFNIHKLISKISETSNKPLISPTSLDDTGAVIWDANNQNCDKKPLVILSKMEGMHSRLSDFPFLAGFHVARAALRDIYVKGGIPISLMVDVHLADDGDIGKLFDFQAGIATVAEISNVPITAGSTLRIGGDMVIGERLTGGIAAVGIMKYSFFRKNIKEGDVILMTEGAGGGTISTTALYSGYPEIIKETINLKFLKTCEILFQYPEICKSIHSMTDVTNGGIRGDLYEINNESGLGVKVFPSKIRSLINKNVLKLLEKTKVDFLGLSTDSLLLFCSPEIAKNIQNLLKLINVKSIVIGKVIKENKIIFVSKSGEEKIIPRFRESNYTEIKKIVDKNINKTENMEKQIQKAYKEAQKKRKFIENYLKDN